MGVRKPRPDTIRRLIRCFPLDEDSEENVRRILGFALDIWDILGLLYVRGEKSCFRGQGFLSPERNGDGERFLKFLRGTIGGVRFRKFTVSPEAHLYVFWEKEKGWVFPPATVSLVLALLRFEEERKRYRRRWSWIFDGSLDSLLLLDSQGRILDINRRVEETLGWERRELLGKDVVTLIQEESWWVLREEAESNRRAGMELVVSSKASGLLSMEAMLSLFEDERFFLLSLRDVRERKRHEAVLLRFALYDQLTEAYSCRFLEEYLKKEIEQARREGYPLTLVVLDIDAFRSVNDRYGHVFGDEVLRVVVQILQESLRSSDIVARYGGDEFVLVLPRAREEDTHRIMERIRQNLKGAQVAGEPFPVHISYGVCLWGGHKTVAEVFQDIDQWVCGMKRGGSEVR